MLLPQLPAKPLAAMRVAVPLQRTQRAQMQTQERALLSGRKING